MPEPIPSRAAIKGHPVHPMLIPFPITLISAALVADVVYALNEGERWAGGWATAAAWILWGAVLMGALAGLAGAMDYFSVREVREHKTAQRHGLGNSLILALTVVNALLRLDDAHDAVVPWGIVLSGVATLLLTYTGWLGGELSYKHMIGVDPNMESGGEPALGSKEHPAS